MKTDNQAHKDLFTIPEAKHNTSVAITKPLPPQRVITGHKQTDAYLWVLEVIQTNEPAHLPAAEEALAKLKITPKEAQERYSNYLLKSGAAPFQIAFSTMSMDNPEGYIKRAKAAVSEAANVRAIFGTYENALENTPAEKMMLVGELADIYGPCWGWTKAEKKARCMHGHRITEVNEKRQAASQGFTDQLPEPSTLSDVVREIEYWREIYWLRNCAAKELGYEYGDGERYHINDREEYLEKRLASIKPVSREEAVEVCKWLLQKNDNLMDRGDLTESIFLNLVGECDNA